jgi:hypothetical protein
MLLTVPQMETLLLLELDTHQIPLEVYVGWLEQERQQLLILKLRKMVVGRMEQVLLLNQ